MRAFTVYPAIDLRGGRVVRLKQGDPARQTTYSDDPLHVAHEWLDAGAAWLHIVNLDGAFGDASSVENLDALKSILSINAQIQFGGGLRSLEDIEYVLELGVSRVILGTIAIEEPELLQKAILKFCAPRVAVGIDVRQGEVRVRGWTEGSAFNPTRLAHEVKKLGVERVIVTDITKDGMDEGIDLDMACRIAEDVGLSVIVAGGVHSVDDVRHAHQAGMEGIVIGRALYEGQISLEEAIHCSQNE
jgi:phosphoribosylformimino-5-aminoimidazole carboxamide ribotide isomerase